MAGLNAPVSYAMQTVALTSTVLNINSTVFNFATSDIEAADRAVLSTNTSNMTCVSWATTTPSPSAGHFLAAGNAPFIISGNQNVRKIHVTSATTLASTISITLEKY